MSEFSKAEFVVASGSSSAPRAVERLPLQRVSLQLDPSSGALRDALVTSVSAATSGVNVRSEIALSRAVDALLQSTSLAGSRTALLLRNRYQSYINGENPGSGYNQPDRQDGKQGVVAQNVAEILGAVDVDPASHGSTRTDPVNKGVLYYTLLSEALFFLLIQVPEYDAETGILGNDFEYLFMGHWSSPAIARIAELEPNASLLVVPVMLEDAILGGISVVSREHAVDPTLDLPWLLELGKQTGSLLEDLQMYGQTNPEHLREARGR